MKGYLELGLSGNISHLKYDDPFITPTTVCNAFWGFISPDGIFHIFLMQYDTGFGYVYKDSPKGLVRTALVHILLVPPSDSKSLFFWPDSLSFSTARVLFSDSKRSTELPPESAMRGQDSCYASRLQDRRSTSKHLFFSLSLDYDFTELTCTLTRTFVLTMACLLTCLPVPTSLCAGAPTCPHARTHARLPPATFKGQKITMCIQF